MKNVPIMTKYGTLNQIATPIKIISIC